MFERDAAAQHVDPNGSPAFPAALPTAPAHLDDGGGAPVCAARLSRRGLCFQPTAGR